MDYVASIGIGTGLDLSGLYAGLQQIQSVKVPKLHITPAVDHAQLTALNRHLDKKVEHVKQVNTWMSRNPIKVRVDTSELRIITTELEKFKSKYSSTSVKLNVSGGSSTDLEKIGQKIADSVGNAVTKSMSQSLPSKLAQGLGSSIGGLLENTLGSVFRGVFENVGRELSGGLTKGISAALESAMGNTIGSTELLGENIGKSLSNAITKKLPKDLKQDLQEVFKETLGEANIVTASRSTRGRQGQQKRTSTRLAQEEITIERRDSLRGLKALRQEQDSITSRLGNGVAAQEKGRELQERLQFNRKLPGLSDKQIAEIDATFAQLNTAMEQLIEEEAELLKQQEQIVKKIETAKNQVQKVKSAQAAIAPKEQPKAYTDAIRNLTGSDLPEDKIPQLIVDDKTLKAKGARAGYFAERNAIAVTSAMYKSIQSNTLNQSELESLYHELQHGVQTGFGSFKGLQADKQGRILNTPVRATGKELRAIAPLIGQYEPSLRMSETDAEIIGRRQARSVMAQRERQQRIESLNQMTGLGGTRYEELTKNQIGALKGRLKETLTLAQSSGQGIKDQVEEFFGKLIKIQSDIDKTIDSIAIAPQDFDASQINELEEGIKKQIQEIKALSQELNEIDRSIITELQIPVNTATPEMEMAMNQTPKTNAAAASSQVTRNAINPKSNTVLNAATSSGADSAIARAKEISASFRTAYSQLKKALGEGNQELARTLADTINKNTEAAKKEIKKITKDLGDEAKFGTRVGSQLANTQGQIGRADKLSQQAIAKYGYLNPPNSSSPDSSGDEDEMKARLLEFRSVASTRSMNPDELKQIEELNNLLQESIQSSDEFDLAFKQVNRNTRKEFKQTSQALDETIQKMEQGVSPADELEEQVGGLAKSAYNGVKAFLLFNVALAVASKMLQLTQQAYETTKAFDSLERSIVFTADSTGEGVKNLEYVRKEVDRLNAPVQDATESFNQLSAALKGTKIEGNAQEIFSALNEAALVRQLTPEQRKRFFYGVVQAAGKPVLSSEEVNLQIGEAFPGAQNIFARALNETPEDFRKNLRTGQYGGADSVLKFSRQLRTEFAGGTEDAANSVQGLENRLGNTRVQLERMLGGAIMPLVSTGLKALNLALELVINNADKIALVLGALALQQLPSVIATIGKLANFLLPKMGQGFKVVAAEAVGFSIQTAALALALKVVFDTLGSFKGSDVLDSAIEKNIKQFKRLEEAANKASGSTAKTFNDLDKKLNRDRSQTTFMERFSRNFNPIERISGTYNQFQSGIRTKSRQDDIREFNKRVDLTLGNSQIKSGDAERARELSKLTADPFLGSAQREAYAKEKETIDVRVRAQKELVDSLLEAANAEIEAIDELWAKSDISRAQADILKKDAQSKIPALEAAKKEIENFSNGQVSLIKVMREQLTKVIGAYADANTAIATNTSIFQARISRAQLNGLTPGQAQYAQQMLQQRSLEAQIQSGQGTLGQLNKYVYTPDNKQILFNQGIDPATVGVEELKRLSDLSNKPEEKLLYERLTKIREIEGTVAQQEAQLAQSQAEVATQLYELGKSVDEYLRGITRQTSELELTVEASQASFALAAEKNRLVSKLQGFQSNFFSGFVDSLISGLDSINAAQQAETQRKQALLQNQFQAEDTIRSGSELMRTLPDGLPSDLVPQSIPAIPVKLDVDALQASAGIQDLKGAIAEAVGISRDLNAATVAVNISLAQTAIAGASVSSEFKEVNTDLQGWDKFLADIGFTWNYVQKEFQAGTKENLELQQRWNNLLSIPGILMQRLAGIVGVTLLKSFNPVLAAVAELLVRLGLFPDSVEKIRSKVLSLGFDFKGVTETVTGLGQSIVDSIGNAIDTVKQKIQELKDGGTAETAQEGIAASFSGFGGTGGSAGASGSGAFASGLYTGPAANIGGSADYHIDSKIAKSIGRDMAIQLIDQMAAAYNAQGREMLFSNAAVAGKTWRTDASREEKYALLEQIDAAHSHSPNPTLWDFDYYVPKKGRGLYDKSTEGAEFLLPSVAGGRVEYASGGGYGNYAVIYDSKGNLVMKTGHGDNRKNLPANRTLASVTASTNLNVGSGSKGQFQLPNVGGAGRIPRGGTIGSAERVQSDPAGAVALVKAAQRLGLDPIEFASLMSWESGGTLNPNVFGGDGNAYKGIIQFSPDNQRTYGTSGQQSIAQQIPAVERYLKDRGFQPGKHDIRHAYSAVLAGQASERYWDASDSNGTTVRNAAPKFRQGEHNARARQFLKDSGINLNNVASSGQRSAVLGVQMNNPNTGNAQRIASGQSQVMQNRSSQDQLAIQQEQQALTDLKTRGELEQKSRTEQTRQSLNQLYEQSLANTREFRNLGFAIGDPTPLREFQQQTTATKDSYDDMRRKLVEFQRQTRAGVEQAKRTESELTAPGYQVQPGQNLQEDIATTRKAIAAGSKTLSEVDAILAGIDDQQKRREAFEKERFTREEKLRRLAARDMLTQEKIAETQAQLRRAQLAQQRNPRDFSQGDPIALQAQLDLMQQLLPLDQKRRQLAEQLRLEQIKPEEYNQAIASLQKQEKDIVDNTEAAKKFGLQERQMQFREADFAFLQRQNQASGALTQEQLRAAELFQQTRPFDTTQGDPNTIRYGQSVIQIEQERQQQLLEQDRFALTNTNRSQEELNAIRAKINQASDKRLENARVEFEQNQQRANQERLDFELRRKQQNQQSDLAVTQTRMAGLGAAGIDSSFLTQQVQDAQNQIQYDSAIRELEKTRALTNLTAEDYARQKTNLDQVLTLQKEQSAIARSMSIFSKRAEYGNLKADVLAGNGAEFTAQAIRRETALAQQTLNFTAQIAQLDALKGKIPNEELERMRRQIIEIDRLKTDQIRQQFADLSREIELAGRDATKGFFKGFLVEGKGIFESLKDSFNQLKNQIMGRLVDIGVEALFKGKNTGKDTGGGLLGTILGSVTGAATGGSPFGFLSGVLGFSEGGMVPGRDIGVDTVPAMLRPGEYVMSRDGVANMGSAFLESVNSGEMPSYQQREYSSGEPVERGGSISIQYEKIGERDYVTREQFEEGVRYAAQQGAQGGARITSNWLRNSPSERRRHGV